MKQIRIGTDAAQEFQEAAAWYEQEQEGLGERFIAAFENALELLKEENPPLTPVQGEASALGARKLLLHKFPYSLIVYEDNLTIVVVALAHHSRKPGFWKSRKAP